MGTIMNFVGGQHAKRGNQMIVLPDDVTTRDAAKELVGKTVVWNNPEGKNKLAVKGEVRSAHGNSGAIRVLFEQGMPGQAISTRVDIQ